jgi:hypothetical protein
MRARAVRGAENAQAGLFCRLLWVTAAEKQMWLSERSNRRRRKGPMQSRAKVDTWVVHLVTIHGKPSGMNAVCPKGEWDAMKLARLGYHSLIRGGIHDEAEVEKRARHVGRQPAALTVTAAAQSRALRIAFAFRDDR